MTILMEILKPKSDNCPAAPQPALQGESVYNEKTKSRKKGFMALFSTTPVRFVLQLCRNEVQLHFSERLLNSTSVITPSKSKVNENDFNCAMTLGSS